MTEARLLSDEEIARSRPSRRRSTKASPDVATPTDQAPAPAALEADQSVHLAAPASASKPRARRAKAAAADAPTSPVDEPALRPVPASTPPIIEVPPRTAEVQGPAADAPARPSRARVSRKAAPAIAPAEALDAVAPAVTGAPVAVQSEVTAPPPGRGRAKRAATSSPAEGSPTVPVVEAAPVLVAAQPAAEGQGPAAPAKAVRSSRRPSKRTVEDTGADASAPVSSASVSPAQAGVPETLVASSASSTAPAPPELAVTPAPLAEAPATLGRAGRTGRRAQIAPAPRLTPSAPALEDESGVVEPVAQPQTDVSAAGAPVLLDGTAQTATPFARPQQNGASNPTQRPGLNGARPSGFRQQPGQQNRPGNGTRPQQPFSTRPPQQGAAPLDGQGEYADGQDARQGRRRRRRRGRNGLQAGPTTVQSAPPLSPQRPTSTPYAEERQPLDFVQQQRMPVFEVHGILDFLPNQEAFLREEDLRHRSDDSLISVRDIRRFDLRNGDIVSMEVRPARGRGPVTVERVISVNGNLFEEMRARPRFEDLTAVYPDRMIKLETGQQPLTTRMIDMIAPVGFGQRALIVSPPKAGKTTLLKNIGQGVTANYPDAEVILCLVGERPEEVTDMRMSLPRATMFASSFDEDVERHGHLCEMALERAKRLAEQGKDVVVLLDSITRLARAYNLGQGGGGGRTLSGGMDASALTTARKIFGAARAIEQGGSLTIIATCLVDTGSRLDDVVYEEFKGTGNMELHLDRGLAERRIFPAIDIGKSSTRKEEMLLDPTTMRFVVLLRRRLAGAQTNYQATENLIERLAQTPSNRAFMELLSRASS